MDEAESDESVWCVVITGVGRTFCADADIKQLSKFSTELVELPKAKEMMLRGAILNVQEALQTGLDIKWSRLISSRRKLVPLQDPIPED